MSVNGFVVNGNTVRYNYNALDNIPSADGMLSKIVEDDYTSTQFNSYTSVSGWKLNDNDGLCTSNSSYKLLKYRVSEGEAIRVTNCDRYQFQNSESVPSSSPSNMVGRVHVSGDYSVVPSGASYLIVSSLTSDSPIAEKYESVLNYVYNSQDSLAVGYTEFESGTYSDADGISKNDNTKRIRNAYPISTKNLVDIQVPSDYLLWIFMMDENRVLLGTMGNWCTYVNKATLQDNVKYINLAIKRPSQENSDISEYVADLEKRIEIRFVDDKIEEVTNAAANTIGYIDHADFELGDLYVNSSGAGTYYTSDTRLRTIHNNPIQLKQGDLVGLDENTQNAVYLVRKKIAEGEYKSPTGTWQSKDWLITADGDYEILIRYQTEGTIVNAKELANLFYIKRTYGTVREKSNIENLSDVYKNELEATITSALAKTTSRSLMFAIITDTHLDNKRVGYYNQTMENLERLNNGLHFNGIFHLGDVINGYDDSETAKYHLRFAVDRLMKINPSKTYIVIGNHDNNNGAGDAQRLTDHELYSIMQRFNEDEVVRTMHSTNGVYDSPTSNYYIDYPALKIRVIVFDSCYYGQGFSDEMIAWMSSLLEDTPAGYHVVLFTHESTEAALNGGSPLGNASAFKALLAQHKDKIYCYIHGHSHYDYVGYDNEFAQIALCSEVPDQPSSSVPSGGIQPARQIGTVTQDCISIIIVLPDEQKVELIRFGAGSDRTIPFRA